MEPSCVRQTLIPGTSKLFSDYLYDADQVKGFYFKHFSDNAAFAESAERIDFSNHRRASLVKALREQNGESATLTKLAKPGTVAVVTGQQVGLFSGPAYTIFKALTAAKLAKHLSDQGIPAVPVFWLATEDHDLAEVDHAWVFNHVAEPARVSVPEPAMTGGPVGEVALGQIPFDELRAGLGELPFADEVVERLEKSYGAKAANTPTLGSAFGSFLRELLKDCGLVYLDPLAPAVREMALPFITQSVHRVPELIQALRERNQQLIAAGYHTQVHIDETTSLVFLIDEGKRVPLRWSEGRFRAKDKSYSAEDLISLDGSLSPNALLRPVLQDYLLPTVSYVGGPSEIAYMAQAQVLYENLLGRMPVIFPRNSFTLLDARAAKLLERYRLHVTDVFAHREQVNSRIAARLVPGGLIEEIDSARDTISSTLGRLQSHLADFDPTLEAAANKSGNKMLYQLDKISRKTARQRMRRDERVMRDASYLTDLIFPFRHLQERFYSIIPFLAQHGWDLPGRLIKEVHLGCPDHMIRTI
ncbi:MAG: bacillithiol biosynthesis cysteine-adding enzyme BshC [Acidobacteriaceae bacterium]|nr:bacillithiol biosynthesis cysteine-adding enzyme BshC [Acidobacteriaceae bacterium]MBV9779333.1 bacillithiol biosynthesis cysteine-adding enzyme BshC [Acidobacteriaceae bacterium]